MNALWDCVLQQTEDERSAESRIGGRAPAALATLEARDAVERLSPSSAASAKTIEAMTGRLIGLTWGLIVLIVIIGPLALPPFLGATAGR